MHFFYFGFKFNFSYPGSNDCSVTALCLRVMMCQDSDPGMLTQSSLPGLRKPVTIMDQGDAASIRVT